ncbi:MAG: LOG family protein, partial [Betaproteobacteria bacterium]
ALPGGLGTFEELFEVWTWRQLGYHDKPLGLLNIDGYYDALLEFIDKTMTSGFVAQAQRDLLEVGTNASELLQRLGSLAERAGAPDDYRHI